MPYIRRNTEGLIVALLAQPEPDASEFLRSDDLQVIAFLNGESAEPNFDALDADFVRVTEDLIYTLIDKGVLMFTDLPADAQRKLLEREQFRSRRLPGALDLMGSSQ